MRVSLKLATAGLAALAAAVVLAAPASAAPYVHRSTSGSWINAEYNDGICHFYYSYNAYDGETHVNRYGDCSRIAIGPNGEAVPLMAVPMAAPPY